jgi:predicted DNA-binding transcriptional regulator YafY
LAETLFGRSSHSTWPVSAILWDTDRSGWRTFRVDRVRPRIPTGPRYAPRDPPDDDLVADIARGVWSASWRHHARVRLHAPAEAVAQRIPPRVGLLEAVDQDACLLRAGAETVEILAVHLGMLGADFEEVTHVPELDRRAVRMRRTVEESPVREV